MSPRGGTSLTHTAYSMALQLTTEFPIVPIVVGASVALAASAFTLYISTASPRWKGAPGLSKDNVGSEESKPCSDPSHSSTATTMCTSTKTPWDTSKEESTQTRIGRAVATLFSFVVVDHTNTPTASSRVCQCQRYHGHSSAFSQPLFTGHVHERGVRGGGGLSSASDGGGGSSSSKRALTRHNSNNSGVNTPTVILSTPPSSHDVGLLASSETSISIHNGGRCELCTNALECNSLPSTNPVFSDGTFNIATANSDMLADYFPDSLETGSGRCSISSQKLLITSDEAAPPPPRRYDWEQQLGETGKTQQTLSHLVGTDALTCSTHMEYHNPVSFLESEDGKELLCLSDATHKDAVHIQTPDFSTDRSELYEPENVSMTNPITDHPGDSYASVHVSAGYMNDAYRREVSLSPPPQLKSQLRSLESRVEQQMRGLVGQSDSETTTTTTVRRGKSTTVAIGQALLSGDVECTASTQEDDGASGELTRPSFAEAESTSSPNLYDTSRQDGQTPIAMATAPMPQSQSQQHDRRADDVFVRHHTEGGASYSLSLTYHDAHGSTRTIDTHPLPPLKFSSPPGGVTTDGTVIANVSASRWLTQSFGSQESVQSSCCPLSMVKNENTSASTTHGSSASSNAESGGGVISDNHRRSGNLVAPLPLLEPTTGPRLDEVAGERGELRIGAFLGGGWCGKVYECLNIETGEVLAAKYLMFESNDPKVRYRLKQLELELEVLSIARRYHMPWIVGFYGTEKRGHSVLMYLEYCAKGSLLDYMLNYGISQSVGSTALLPAGVPVETTNAGASHQTSVRSEGSQNHRPYNSLEQPQGEQKESPQHDEEQGREVETNTGDSREKSANSSFFRSSPTSMLGVGGASSEMPALPLLEVQRFTLQTVEALHFLHAHGYVHLDVKTANILVTENRNARLADFGCSMRLKQPVSPCLGKAHVDQRLDERSGPTTTSNAAFGETCTAAAPPFPILAEDDAITELRGTAVYMAPEMIRFERERIGTAGDVWSLGCVVMELATGAAPWRHVAKDKLRVLFRIGSAREDLPLPPSVVYTAQVAREWLSHHSADGKEICTPNDTAAVTISSSSSSSSSSSTWSDENESNSDDGIGRTPPTAAGESEGKEAKRRRLENTINAADTKVSLLDPITHDSVTMSELHQRMFLRAALEGFLSVCLRVRPEDRPSCEELLQHPFLTIH